MTDMEKYAEIMKEIKARTEFIDAFLYGQCDTTFVFTTTETVGLQFRKVFELIAFASLAANRNKYSSVHANFSKHWEAAKLLRNLHRINPNFYPAPVREVKSDQPDTPIALESLDQGYLTQADLTEAHGRCGALMHGSNPFGNSIDYAFFQESFPIWRAKFVNLLNSHKVHLLDDTGFYLFHMREEGNNEISWYRLELIGVTP